MKVLSISNKKGGAGKTVVSALLAVTLSRDYNKKVLMLDVDEQQTLTDVRRQDQDYCAEFPYELIAKPFRVLVETANGVEIKKDSNGDEVNPAADFIEDLKENPQYDVVLVDMPGRTDDENILDVITVLDGILVPIVTDQNDKLSSAKFLESVHKIKEYYKQQGVDFTTYGFQNMLDGRREEQELEQFCRSINLNLFDTGLRDMVIYSRYNTYDSYLAKGSKIMGDYVPRTIKDELKSFTEEFIEKFNI
ncbi:ParA family protein [Tunicatimonas pelagia]|uniref:ParA family protein n=1 Tax=Tunicatimonas pelagia TaxID=931531 RepID=UPI002665BC2F|nr:ParA family protein [Tunicatimonas pelagia]WKN46472.1 ParA family protein [Tunicatimonas pelagia]